MLGKALSGDLSCPCDRSSLLCFPVYFLSAFCKNLLANRNNEDCGDADDI